MKIGESQVLIVDHDSPHGLFLTDGESTVLLPNNQRPDQVEIGDKLSVFVYTDSEDRPIATRKKPFVQVGEFALLQAISTSPTGAFFDWGLEKDLFCPIREQRALVKADFSYVVAVYLDQVSNRVACSTKVGKFLDADGSSLTAGSKVDIMVFGIGRNWIDVIVGQRYKGSIFPDEWVEDLDVGDRRTAYIKQIRESDHRIAISLRPQGLENIFDQKSALLQLLAENHGYLPLSDKSSPEQIQEVLNLSKGAFKKLIGSLYREGEILIEDTGIRLSKS